MSISGMFCKCRNIISFQTVVIIVKPIHIHVHLSCFQNLILHDKQHIWDLDMYLLMLLISIHGGKGSIYDQTGPGISGILGPPHGNLNGYTQARYGHLQPCRHGTIPEPILKQCDSFRSERILNQSDQTF